MAQQLSPCEPAPGHHFPTAADLRAEIAATGYEDFHQALDDGAAKVETASAKLQAMGRSYVTFAKAHPAVYKLMFGAETPPKSEHLQHAMSAAWNQLTSAVTAAYGPDEAQLRAVSTWSLVHGFAMLAINHRLPPTLDQARALETMTSRL
jgi:hypothetical protein